MYRTIIPIGKTPEDTEEILQDVFLKIFRSLPEYQNRGLKTWMARIAVNTAIDFMRKKNKIPKVENYEVDFCISGSEKNEPEEKLIHREQQIELHRKLRDVPKNYRDVLTAFYLEEKSQREIAELQGVQEKTIEMKLYRARKWMKEHWREDAK